MVGSKLWLPPKEWSKQANDKLPQTLTFSSKANGFDFSLDIQNNSYQSGYRYSITVSEPNHDYEDPGFNLPVFENASQLTLTVKEIV